MRKILLSSLVILLAIGLIVSCQQTTTKSAAPQKNAGTPEVKKPVEPQESQMQAKEAELAKLWYKAIAQLNAKEYAQALETLYQADKIEPSNPNIQTSIAYVFALKGDYDKALVIYNRLLEKNPGNLEFRAGIANVYTIKGDYDKALEIYNDMLKTSPNNPSVLNSKALVYSKKGDYDKALGIYQQMLKTMPDSNMVLYNIACIYSLKGNKTEACEYLKKSIQVPSGFYDWKQIEEDADLNNIRGEEAYKKLIDALKLVHPVMPSETDSDGSVEAENAEKGHSHESTGEGGKCECPNHGKCNMEGTCPNEKKTTEHKHMHEWCDQCPDHDKCLKEGKCQGDCENKKPGADKR